jgi:amidase
VNLSEYAGHDTIGLADLLRRREIRPLELAELALVAIEKINPILNAVVEVFADRAAALDDRTNGASELPFPGVPFLGKDLPFEKGVHAEMGSELARGYVAPVDTELAIRLRAAGAINLGRTTTSEFAFAATTENRATGRTRNPWNIERSTAGSSGGAAASVASGAVPFAQGSDAGGSIRTPSSFCGLVGLKPTRARVPLAPFPMLSQAGLNNFFVLTRTVRDCAALLDAVEGPAVGDTFEIARPTMPYRAAIARPPSSLRIAFTAIAWSGLPVDKAVADAVRRTAKLCEELGHRVEEAAPAFDYATYLGAQKTLFPPYVVQDVDAVAQALGRTPGPDNLQSTTWDLYYRGRTTPATDLLAALDTYSDIVRRVAVFWQGYDLLLTPTCTVLPQLLGVNDPDRAGADTDTMFDQLAPQETFTSLFNATGQPALSLPLQESDDGMPIGMQFVGRFGDETRLLALAAQLEAAQPWSKRRPAVHVANL